MRYCKEASFPQVGEEMPLFYGRDYFILLLLKLLIQLLFKQFNKTTFLLKPTK